MEDKGKPAPEEPLEGTVRETVGTPVGEPTEGPTEGPTEKWRMNEPRENPGEPTVPPTEPPTEEWYCKDHGAVTPRVSSGRMFCPVRNKILRKEPYEQEPVPPVEPPEPEEDRSIS